MATSAMTTAIVLAMPPRFFGDQAMIMPIAPKMIAMMAIRN